MNKLFLNMNDYISKIIVNLMHGWEIEALRYEIAQDAKASIKAFHRGELKAKPLEEVIEELRDL